MMTGGTGSYLYMAEEVCRHEPYNTKADVYSFAMIFYEMVTGLWPFQGMDPVQAAVCAATDGLRPLFNERSVQQFSGEEAALVPRVQSLIKRCWARQPAERCALPPLRLCPVPAIMRSSLWTTTIVWHACGDACRPGW
jgi:serine/threonine protein kinase